MNHAIFEIEGKLGRRDEGWPEQLRERALRIGIIQGFLGPALVQRYLGLSYCEAWRVVLDPLAERSQWKRDGDRTGMGKVLVGWEHFAFQPSLWITDVGHAEGRMTVTNDAEYVVARLWAGGWLSPGSKLFYIDSEGEKAQLLHENGRFTGFAPGPTNEAGPPGSGPDFGNCPLCGQELGLGSLPSGGQYLGCVNPKCERNAQPPGGGGPPKDRCRFEKGECFSCGEGLPRGECPKSPRPCGHHCDCSWEQDQCCFCGSVFDEEETTEDGDG